MNDPVSYSKLSTADDWNLLHKTLDPKSKIKVVFEVLRHLREGGVASVIVEETYLDRDFTDSFSKFYATVFKRHTKLCRRFHFFKKDICQLFSLKDPIAITRGLQSVGDSGEYSGFIVARPVQHAPLGIVVIDLPPNPAGLVSHLLVRADYEAHLLGAKLTIRGVPLTQQDQRVGACAQASIWMAGRHFHMRHRGPWFTTVDITQAATKVAYAALSMSLPAGSEFLVGDNMVQALRAMGRETFTYQARVDGNPPTANWGNLRPHDIINRYVDSGIPVILSLFFPEQSVGHAVVATGHTLKELPPGGSLPNEPTRAEFCECFLVNDDSMGANLRVPVNVGSPAGETPYTIAQNLQAILIPLPSKVFVPAEYAEKLSWELLKYYRSEWHSYVSYHNANLGASRDAGNKFVDQIDKNEVIARTYLTYGWKYKHRMMQNSIGDDFKNILLYQDLPKFVWVTEFGTIASLNVLDYKERRIFAHAVVDATASVHWEARCMFHAPGLGKRWFHDPTNPFGEYKDAVIPIADDNPYFPKIRGQDVYDFRQS
jgi:hypothetical protein